MPVKMGDMAVSDEFYDYSNVIPEDVLREVLESEKRVCSRRRKARYPTSRDIVEAVIRASERARGLHPSEFPDLVYRILEEWGFSTRFVTIKRIWRVYENLVNRGVISDVLGVVRGRR